MYRILFVLMLAMSISAIKASQRLSVQAVEKATFSGKIPASDQTSSPLLIKAEVLLDRAHFSPGQIDGKMGENVTKALAAYADAHGLQTGRPLTNEIVSSLSADTRPILTQYMFSPGI
jgi:peptidoglycan hydrolase-like protein with peptidoglycan-binding domain